MTLSITEFTAQDYKGLRAVTIRPDSRIVTIGGRNAQGKTSVLDGIYSVLQGKAAARETRAPIRDGQDSAFARLVIADEDGRVKFIATRKWKGDDGGTLTVQAGDGARYSSPQALLDATMGSISFDPLAFLNQDARTQVRTLIEALGDSLGFDPAELETRRKGAFDERTEVSREVKRLEGQLSGYPPLDASLPKEETSASALMAEWQAGTEHNEKRRRAWETVAEYNSDVTKARDAVAQAEKALAQARDRFDYMTREADAAEARATELAPSIDTDAVRARLDDVEVLNTRIRTQSHRLAVEEELDDRRGEVAALTAQLGAIDEEKASGIAAANLPVPGLSFNDDGVLYNGVPFSQTSNAERFRVSAALAMSANPELRVMRIDNRESLDSSNLAILEALAAEHDYQVWITRVDESGTAQFTIEDGNVLEFAKAVSA